eukprot:g4020.t1
MMWTLSMYFKRNSDSVPRELYHKYKDPQFFDPKRYGDPQSEYFNISIFERTARIQERKWKNITALLARLVDFGAFFRVITYEQFLNGGLDYMQYVAKELGWATGNCSEKFPVTKKKYHPQDIRRIARNSDEVLKHFLSTNYTSFGSASVAQLVMFMIKRERASARETPRDNVVILQPIAGKHGADCKVVNNVSPDARAKEVHSVNSKLYCGKEVKGSLAQAAASTQELVHIVGVAYLASSTTSLFHCKRCVVEGALLGSYVHQVLPGFPVPRCEKTLREFRNRCILLFYAWDREELTQALLPFVITQKHREIFSLFVSACLRVSTLQQALIQAAGAETLACLKYLTEHTQAGKPWTVASVGAYLASRNTSACLQRLPAREPVLVDECGLCLAPNPATGGLDLQALAMLVQGDIIIMGTSAFRHKLRLNAQWRQHVQAHQQGDLHAQEDLSTFVHGVQIGGWNACDPLLPALYNARTRVMSLLGYEPQPGFLGGAQTIKVLYSPGKGTVLLPNKCLAEQAPGRRSDQHTHCKQPEKWMPSRASLLGLPGDRDARQVLPHFRLPGYSRLRTQDTQLQVGSLHGLGDRTPSAGSYGP